MKGAHPAASSRPPCRPLRLATLVAGTAVLGLSGCASNLSGIGGTPTYACKAPTGAQCTSVSGVYANAGQGARQLLSSDTLRTGGSGALGTPAVDAALDRPVVRSGAVRPVSSATAIEPRPTTTNPQVAAAGTAPAVSPIAPLASAPATSPAALRTAPRILRMWIAPWEDSDGDLHEASTVHVLIDHGRWLIERVRPAPRGPRMGVTPPATVGTSPAGTPPGGQAQGISPRANASLDQPEP